MIVHIVMELFPDRDAVVLTARSRIRDDACIDSLIYFAILLKICEHLGVGVDELDQDRVVGL